MQTIDPHVPYDPPSEYLQRYDFAQVPPEEVQLELQNPTDLDTAHKVSGERVTVPPGAAEEITPAEQVVFGFDAQQAQQGPANTLDEHLGEMMGDAPMCDQCGHITVRNGACYKCLNCGNSMGCS